MQGMLCNNGTDFNFLQNRKKVRQNKSMLCFNSGIGQFIL